MSEIEKNTDTETKIDDIKMNFNRPKTKFKHQRGALAIVEDNKQYLALFAVIVTALLVILVSILGLGIPVVSVCLILVLEVAMSVCLHNEPLWLHILVVAVEIIAGIVFGKTVFMILCAAIYLVCLFALKFLQD